MLRSGKWLLLILCLLVQPLWGADSGVKFSGITRQVEVRPDRDKVAWKFAKLDTVLHVEDHVRTGEDSSAVLSFTDMTTFVLKAESEVVIATPPGKDSKVKLVAGNIWVNVKKMIKDGSMEIDMTQVVAGIKGTNITCSSKPGEDRIQVLRGEVEATVKSSQEKIHLKEGEVLVVKKGGKTDQTPCDPPKIQEEWKKELETPGENIDIDEIPGAVKEVMQAEAQGFKDLQNQFKTLSDQPRVTENEEQEFRKNGTRFLGLLPEHQGLLHGFSTRLAKAAIVEKRNSGKMAKVVACRKLVAQALAAQQTYQAEVLKMLNVDLVRQPAAAIPPGAQIPPDSPIRPAAPDTSEVDQFLAEVAGTLSAIEALIAELSGNLTGQSQDWFTSALERCTEALGELAALLPRLSDLQEKYPGNSALSGVQRQISSYQGKLAGLLKNLAVVEIDGDVMNDIQQSEETMADAILKLKGELESYDSLPGTSNASSDRIQASLRILNHFSRARRQFLNVQRMYESTLRSVSSNKYKTKETEDLESTYERVSNTFQMLGIVIEQLESRLRELEGQAGPLLK